MSGGKGKAISYLKARLLLLTEGRRKWLTPALRQRLKESAIDFCGRQGCLAIDWEGESDYLQLLFAYPPHLSLSQWVEQLKVVTSRLIWQEFPTAVQGIYPPGASVWSQTYGMASCSTLTGEALKKALRTQVLPD